jgi:hypothetical protein
VSALKDGRFWFGLLVGYGILVVFPQFNIRTMGRKGS